MDKEPDFSLPSRKTLSTVQNKLTLPDAFNTANICLDKPASSVGEMLGYLRTLLQLPPPVYFVEALGDAV
jgi:hypothetical protein